MSTFIRVEAIMVFAPVLFTQDLAITTKQMQINDWLELRSGFIPDWEKQR